METGIRVDTRLGGIVTPGALQAWKTGQILKATVVTGTPTGTGGGRAVLQIGANKYAVRSQTPLQTGDTLKLEVKRTQPEPVLQRLPPSTSASNRSEAVAGAALDRSIRTLLTQQGSLSNNLQSLVEKLPQLSPQTAQRLTTLLASLPSSQSLATPRGLQNALAASGNQLEATLQQNKPPSANDLKLQLAQTLTGLSSAEAHSARGPLESMAARITLNQLHSTQPAGTQGSHWLIEIPLRTEQGFREVRLEIETQQNTKHASTDESADWSVNLRLDLPRLGPIETRIASRGGSISARFWAEHTHTATRIESALPELAAAWQDKGLRPGALQAYHGRAPSGDDTMQETPSGLVDAHA